MNKDNTNIALLPSGFADLLPPEAGREADAIARLMGVFSSFGYHRVKPPLVEFEESLVAPGPGAKLAQTMFRLMDPVSHRMMGVRSDITAQIARIVSSRLKGEARPLRLTYANDVLRTKGSQQRTARQFTQVGCEIIGPADMQADIEICIVALEGMRRAGIGAVTLDIAMPHVLHGVLNHFEMDEAQRKDVSAALADRDVERLGGVAGDAAGMLQSLVKAAGPIEHALDDLRGLTLPESAAVEIIKLSDFYDGLKKALEEFGITDVSVSLDPVETSGFEYHSGLAFALFSADARSPLGRGGRYDIEFGEGETESACGFTLYMDTVRTAMPKLDPKKIVFVSADEGWGVIKALQEEGWIVTRGAAQGDGRGESTHIYKDGKIEEIK